MLTMFVSMSDREQLGRAFQSVKDVSLTLGFLNSSDQTFYQLNSPRIFQIKGADRE